VTTEPSATETDQRVALLEIQVRVLSAMVRCQGRGLSSVMACLGIDDRAACAELVGEDAVPG
jgi:hypothetical protein